MGNGAERGWRGASSTTPLAQLWAGDLCVEHADDTLTISVLLEWETPPEHLPPHPDRRLRIEVSDLDRLGGDRRNLLAAHTPASATSLVPLLAVIAATTGADLTIEAPVCPTSLAAARQAIAVGQARHGWAAVTLGATAGATGPPRREGAGREGAGREGEGLVFSLGIEPLAALVELRKIGRPATHLLAVDGVGPRAARSPSGYLPPTGAGAATLAPRSWRTEVMAANAARLPLVRATTNARELGLPDMTTTIAEQAGTAACALALAGVVGSITLPGTRSAATSVWPDSASLWSSAAVDLRTAAPTSAIDASTLVATSPWALQWLRVCPYAGGEGNCGVCSPCQFTLATLWIAGLPATALHAFDHAVDPNVVRALPPANHQDPQRRQDHLDLISALAAVAGGSGGERAVAPHDDRLLAAALADAWTTHLERAATGTHALSA